MTTASRVLTNVGHADGTLDGAALDQAANDSCQLLGTQAAHSDRNDE